MHNNSFASRTTNGLSLPMRATPTMTKLRTRRSWPPANPGPQLSLIANPASITVASPGQSGSTSLTSPPSPALTGTFNLVPQCANLPSENNCGVSPASVTFSSTMTTATVMLTVATRAPSSVPATRHFQPTHTRRGALSATHILAGTSVATCAAARPPGNSNRLQRGHVRGAS